MRVSRRRFIASGALVGAAMVSGRVEAAGIPEAPSTASPKTQPPLFPRSGPDYRPVATLNGWTLPWRQNGDWKEFHLVAEPVVRELAPGLTAHLWGCNGQSPGPTIECVEGDRLRIFVTNKLSEPTAIHWHGIPLPNGMDGVGGLTQPHIGPGKTFVYEFAMQKAGTFLYHPHADARAQVAMGIMGAVVVHPRDPAVHRADRDFVVLLNAFDVEPAREGARIGTRLWTFNSRVFPGINPLVARKGDRVRVRIGNLGAHRHSLHLHGHAFTVTGTGGGWVPESARWPETAIDVPAGALRVIEFTAEAEGDWALHAHAWQRAGNTIGPDATLGTETRDLAPTIRLERQTPPPGNALPSAAGFGPFGPVAAGGMFTVVKVRAGRADDDYRDPGWYRHPAGTVAYEFEGEMESAPKRRGETGKGREVEVKVVRPTTRRRRADL